MLNHRDELVYFHIALEHPATLEKQRSHATPLVPASNFHKVHAQLHHPDLPTQFAEAGRSTAGAI
jgi:hypothetical protein